MKAEDLYEAVGEAGEDLLERSEGAGKEKNEDDASKKKAASGKKRRKIIYWAAAAAACILVIVTGSRAMRLGSAGSKTGADAAKEKASEQVEVTTSEVATEEAAEEAAEEWDEAAPESAEEEAEDYSGEVMAEESGTSEGNTIMADKKAASLVRAGSGQSGDEDISPKEAEDTGTAQLMTFETEVIRTFITEGSGNSLISPVSLYFALAALTETAAGETREELMTALGEEDIAALRENVKSVWLNSSYNLASGICTYANSIWLRNNCSYNMDTLEIMAGDYFMSSFAGEMGSQEYDQLFQDWVAEGTDGNLKELTGDLSFSPETVFAIASTVHYETSWMDRFSEMQTGEGIFHAESGDITVQMMTETPTTYYYRGENFGAVGKLLGDRNIMWFFLPDEGSGIEEVIAGDDWTEILLDCDSYEDKERAIVAFKVPKFDISDKTDLVQGLGEMGIKLVFDPFRSDFTNLTDEPLTSITRAEQDIRVAIDEEGVIADALTVFETRAEDAIFEDDLRKIDFTLDRPFVFVIADREGVIKFAGAVREP